MSQSGAREIEGISGLVTDTKAQVVSFVSCAAAAFAAASALAFPVEIKLLSLVCAAHLQIATLSGKRMASKSLDTSDAFNIGCPSDFCASKVRQNRA